MVTLKIGHLYPDLMDTYGDKGNIITLVKRCQWRGIKVSVKTISAGQTINPKEIDLYFFGGGQDRAQNIVSQDLKKGRGKALKEAIENGAALLSICGGYQLLQKFYKPHKEPPLEGVGIFNAYTKAGQKRLVGNLLIELSKDILKSQNLKLPTLIGFENHSGKTYLLDKEKFLGKVLIGNGNNGEDKTEGAVYKNAFGCYLHGSLLPKNPQFADLLIKIALKRRYGEVDLSPLDNKIEIQAHKAAIKGSLSQTPIFDKISFSLRQVKLVSRV